MSVNLNVINWSQLLNQPQLIPEIKKQIKNPQMLIEFSLIQRIHVIRKLYQDALHQPFTFQILTDPDIIAFILKSMPKSMQLKPFKDLESIETELINYYRQQPFHNFDPNLIQVLIQTKTAFETFDYSKLNQLSQQFITHINPQTFA